MDRCTLAAALGSRSNCDDALAKGLGDGLDACGDAKLRLGAIDMKPDCARANAQKRANFRVRKPDGDLAQALCLAHRERVNRG